MANPMTILVTVAALFFGFYYFTKMGCKGDIEGVNTTDGALCFPGFESFGIPGLGDQEAQAVPDDSETSGSDEPPTDPGGSEAEKQRLVISQFKDRNTAGRDSTGKPLPITPAKKTSLAHAFAAGIQDQITIA